MERQRSWPKRGEEKEKVSVSSQLARRAFLVLLQHYGRLRLLAHQEVRVNKNIHPARVSALPLSRLVI